jgi:hypothetical protein
MRCPRNGLDDCLARRRRRDRARHWADALTVHHALRRRPSCRRNRTNRLIGEWRSAKGGGEGHRRRLLLQVEGPMMGLGSIGHVPWGTARVLSGRSGVVDVG